MSENNNVNQQYVNQQYAGQFYANPNFGSYIGQPYANQYYVNQPYVNQPFVGQPYINQPYVNQPFLGQPYINQPYVNQPYINQPYVNQPYINQLYMNQPPLNPNDFNNIVQNTDVKREISMNLIPKCKISIKVGIKIINLEVEFTDTILNLKTILYEKEGFEIKSQKLFFDNKLLEDDHTVRDYNIIIGSSLDLILLLDIFIRTITGKVIKLRIESIDTVEKIKKMIEEKEGIPENNQQLTYAGKILENNQKLDNYSIGEDFTIFLSNILDKTEYDIIIKIKEGKTLSLSVEPTYTIEKVKSMIQEKEDISMEKQILIFNGKILEDNKNLKDYNIKMEDNILNLEIKPEPKYNIFIKMISGKTITIMATSSDSIEKIKSIIEEKQNIPVERQKLIFGRKNLENNHTLQSYNIQKDNTINLIINYNIKIYDINIKGYLVDPNFSFTIEEINSVINENEFDKEFTLNVRSTYTIEEIKSMIKENEYVPGNLQALVFQSKILKDNLTIEDYNIQNESTIYLIYNSIKNGLYLEIKPEPKYNIFIKMMSGKTITIMATSSDSIEKIKSIIEEKEDIPMERQKLVFGRKNLENDRTLESYNIQKDNTINLFIKFSQTFFSNIIIKFLDGKDIELEFNPLDTIKEIKQMIEEKKGISVSRQRLIFTGKILENDDLTLEDYNISNGSKIHVVLRYNE